MNSLSLCEMGPYLHDWIKSSDQSLFQYKDHLSTILFHHGNSCAEEIIIMLKWTDCMWELIVVGRIQNQQVIVLNYLSELTLFHVATCLGW